MDIPQNQDMRPSPEAERLQKTTDGITQFLNKYYGADRKPSRVEKFRIIPEKRFSVISYNWGHSQEITRERYAKTNKGEFFPNSGYKVEYKNGKPQKIVIEKLGDTPSEFGGFGNVDASIADKDTLIFDKISDETTPEIGFFTRNGGEELAIEYKNGQIEYILRTIPGNYTLSLELREDDFKRLQENPEEIVMIGDRISTRYDRDKNAIVIEETREASDDSGQYQANLISIPTEIDPNKISRLAIEDPDLERDPYNAEPSADTSWINQDLRAIVGMQWKHRRDPGFLNLRRTNEDT